MNTEKIFADGFTFKRRDNAPEFVVGRQSIKVDEAIAFLKSNEKKGWVNIDIKQAKSGNYYCELDTWEAKPQGTPTLTPDVVEVLEQSAEEDELPF